MGDKSLKGLKKVICNLDQIISAVSLAGIVIFVCVNVFCRYVLGYIFNWMEELCTILFVWCTFLGISSAYKTNDHVGINVLVMLFPKKVQRIIMIIVNLFCMVVSLKVLTLSFKFCQTSWTKTTPIIGIPYTFVNISITFGFGLMVIYSIVKIINLIRCKPEDVEV